MPTPSWVIWGRLCFPRPEKKEKPRGKQLRTAPATQRTAPATQRSERRRPLSLPLELRQLLLHRLPQPLGRAAQVDDQERLEGVAELVRHDAHLVAAQIEEDWRRHVAAAAAAALASAERVRGAIACAARAR